MSRPALPAADAAGAAHLATLAETDRRRYGVYYTPGWLASQLVELALGELPPGRPVAACEPACGAGAFAVPLVEALRRRPGSTLVLADRDAAAAGIAGGLAGSIGGVRVETVTGDVLRGPGRRIWERRYDLVIGNPPFAAARVGPVPNLAAAFVARAVACLAPGGVLSFVLPRPLAYVERWRPVRELLWREGRLEGVVEVHRTIEVGMEQIVLLFARAPAPSRHAVRVMSATARGLAPRYRVPAELSRGPTLAISRDPLSRRIIAAVERRAVPLAVARPEIARGLTVQRWLIPAGSGAARWVGRGEIDHYRVVAPRALPEAIEERLRAAADRQQGIKILAQRRVSRRLRPEPHLVTRAALDLDGGLRATDTALVVRIDDEALRLLTLLVLNSDLGAYLLEKLAFDGNTRTTPDLDRAYLLRLALPDARGRALERFLAAARSGDRPLAERLLHEHFELDRRIVARLSAERGWPPAGRA